nr:site-specific integrase [Fortiea contorta]
MSDTPYSPRRASPKANDDTGFDDAVESLKKSLLAPIERYFAATEDEQDVIALMLANIRAPSTRREYQKDLRKFFVAMTGIEPNVDSVLEFLHLTEKRAVAVVLKYKAKLLAIGLKEATVNRRLSSIKSLVKFARKLGVCSYTLEDVELEKVKAYRDTTGVDAQSINSVIQLIERSTVHGQRDYALLRLLWENLLRRNEVSQLNIDDWEQAINKQESIVKASQSDSAKAKARKKRTLDDLPVHSFQTLLADLGTIAKNKIESTVKGANFIFDKITEPTPLQQKALDLLGVSLICTQ